MRIARGAGVHPNYVGELIGQSFSHVWAAGSSAEPCPALCMYRVSRAIELQGRRQQLHERHLCDTAREGCPGHQVYMAPDDLGVPFWLACKDGADVLLASAVKSAGGFACSAS